MHTLNKARSWDTTQADRINDKWKFLVAALTISASHSFLFPLASEMHAVYFGVRRGLVTQTKGF